MLSPMPMPGRPAPGNVLPFKPLASTDAGRSALADLLTVMNAAEPVSGDGPPGVPIPVRRLRAGETLFHEGSRAESVYFVRSGTFKIFHTAEDGYEQVLGFSGRTEVLGFDAVSVGEHSTEAVALEDSSVFALRIPDMVVLAQQSAGFASVLHLAVSQALARQRELVDVMAAAAAEVRLARFLLHTSRRMAALGQSPRRFVLRTNRRDIASYLGVAHETVSRSFTALSSLGLVQVDCREVEITDMAGLHAMSHGTRRKADEPGAGHGRAARATARAAA